MASCDRVRTELAETCIGVRAARAHTLARHFSPMSCNCGTVARRSIGMRNVTENRPVQRP
jgi:hypothetical protein